MERIELYTTPHSLTHPKWYSKAQWSESSPDCIAWLPACLLHAPYSHFVCTVQGYRAPKDSSITAQLHICVHPRNRVENCIIFAKCVWTNIMPPSSSSLPAAPTIHYEFDELGIVPLTMERQSQLNRRRIVIGRRRHKQPPATLLVWWPTNYQSTCTSITTNTGTCLICMKDNTSRWRAEI